MGNSATATFPQSISLQAGCTHALTLTHTHTACLHISRSRHSSQACGAGRAGWSSLSRAVRPPSRSPYMSRDSHCSYLADDNSSRSVHRGARICTPRPAPPATCGAHTTTVRTSGEEGQGTIRYSISAVPGDTYVEIALVAAPNCCF